MRNVRMVEHCQRVAFESKAAQGVGIIVRTTQYLERYFAMRMLLFGQIDRTHSTTTEQAENAEFAKLFG